MESPKPASVESLLTDEDFEILKIDRDSEIIAPENPQSEVTIRLEAYREGYGGILNGTHDGFIYLTGEDENTQVLATFVPKGEDFPMKVFVEAAPGESIEYVGRMAREQAQKGLDLVLSALEVRNN